MTPERLSTAIARLIVAVDEVAVEASVADVPSYPGGSRPTSTVMISGAGRHGRGEHVGWTMLEHTAFAALAPKLPRGRLPLSEWLSGMRQYTVTPYESAAAEAAAIDLALRQQEVSLAELSGREPRPARYVVSFSSAEAGVALTREPSTELKLDVDPAWNDAFLKLLAATGRVATLDFKLTGAIADHERAHAAIPSAWIEDPAPGDTDWSPSLRRRLSLDAAMTSAEELERLSTLPGAVNVKPGRMGGVLAALDLLQRSAELGVTAYLGGMHEIGVGRRQLWTLASLFTPDGPNDVAPIALGDSPAERPGRIVADATQPGLYQAD